jgi:DNA-binding beta-propeller fold protein YncE
MVYDSTGKHVFVVNGDSGTLTVIDPMTDSATRPRLWLMFLKRSRSRFMNCDEIQYLFSRPLPTEIFEAR